MSQRPPICSEPTDLLPKCFADDPLAALTWWLRNPLLLHYYPTKMAASTELAATLAPEQRRRMLWKLREQHGWVRANKPRLEGMGELSLEDLMRVIGRIEDTIERDDVTRFALRLTAIDRGWLAEQLCGALAARAGEQLASNGKEVPNG